MLLAVGLLLWSHWLHSLKRYDEYGRPNLWTAELLLSDATKVAPYSATPHSPWCGLQDTPGHRFLRLLPGNDGAYSTEKPPAVPS